MCAAKKTGGEGCRKVAVRGDTLCGTHCATRRKLGHHFFQFTQVWIIGRVTNREANRLEDQMRKREIHEQVRETIRQTVANHRDAVIANNNVDPHPVTELPRGSIRKRIQYLHMRNAPGDQDEEIRLRVQIQPRVHQFVNALMEARWVDPDAETESDDEGAPVRRAAPAAGELARFARDAQNVHTARMVKQTQEIVERVTKIPVPVDYQWSTGSVKTPGEIMVDTKISQSAAWQLMSQYAQPVSIYDMEPGIYGKTLDSMWQYIKGSPDKEDLCKILKQEMEDNIGMCAQGNLTRICNILAGYMEGVGSTESLAERLGRLLPALMSVKDQTERVRQAVQLLKENGAPREEWEDWIGALVDDGDVTALIEAV